MTEDKKTAHTESELLAIFEENKFDKKYFSYFEAYYQLCFGELYDDMKDESDEDFGSESLQASALSFSIEYMNSFTESIRRGHCEEWAAIIAKYIDEKEYVAFDYAYSGIYEKDPQQAKEELLIHCKHLNADEHYIRYFLYMFDQKMGYENPLEKAKKYSEFYGKMIALGKSAVFAHEYADLMAWDTYTEVGCFSYAFAYDNAIQNGKSKDYAQRYGDIFSDYVGNHFGNFSQTENDEDFPYWDEKIRGNMKGWEYATEHNLSDIKSFTDLYDTIHINTHYADEPLSRKLSSEEIDKMILEKVLKNYNKNKC